MSDRPAETEYSALQALLQIRTDAGDDHAIGGGGGSSVGNDTASAATTPPNPSQHAAAVNINANANFANLLRMGASSAILQQAQAQAQITLPPAQLAAIRASAAAATLQNSTNGLLHAAALQNPTFAGTGSLPSPFLVEAMAQNPALVAAAVATAPRSPALDLPRSPALSPLRPSGAVGLSPGVSGTISPPQASLTGEAHVKTDAPAEDVADKKIRKDEVEAALRSKPQRGRKRENLNAEERLELTRTRNREHAKSTRIRKKARYQELLDTEQKFLDLKNQDELESKRRETVMGFLSTRASMLQNTIRTTLKPKQVSPEALKSTAQNGASGENRAISFDHTKPLHPQAQVEGQGTPNVYESGKTLKDFLADESSFSFETSLGDIHAVDSSAMIRFDENVARRLEHMFGPDAASCSVEYRALGSSAGIAMNKDSTAFARVELVVSTTQQANPHIQAAGTAKDGKLLLSSLVSFEFVKGSHLTRSIAWSILKDNMAISGGESVNGSKSDSTAKESLESQIVYPSVVSFDEAAQRGRAKEKAASQQDQHDNMDNPGMSL